MIYEDLGSGGTFAVGQRYNASNLFIILSALDS